MARFSPATRSPRFRRSGRSRRQHRQPHRRSPRPPILPDIHGQRPSRVPRHGPLRRIPPASTPTGRPPENRFPHRLSPAVRGFLPWRKSYTCRCLISFTEPDVRDRFSALRFRPFVQVGYPSRDKGQDRSPAPRRHGSPGNLPASGHRTFTARPPNKRAAAPIFHSGRGAEAPMPDTGTSIAVGVMCAAICPSCP